MPTTHTVKPDGGGDFTTLQAWENFADGQTTPDIYQAECYGGTGNLGSELDVNGWSFTPDANNYPRVYVAAGEGHGLQSGGTPARIVNSGTPSEVIDIFEGFTRIEGIQINMTAGSSTRAFFVRSGAGGDPVIAKDVLFECTPGNTLFTALSGQDLTCINCVAHIAGGTTQCFGFNNATCYNCVSINESSGANAIGFEACPVVKNSYGATPDAGSTADTFRTITTQSHNISDDASAAGTGSLTKAAADQFVDWQADWNLKTGADCIDAGTDVSSENGGFSDDALGNARGATWDVGAHEFGAGGGGSANRRRRFFMGAAA